MKAFLSTIGRRVLPGLLLVTSICLLVCSLFIEGRASVEAVKCRDYFSICTEGGCGGQPNWRTFEPCGIWCDPSDQYARITCQTP